MMRIIRPTARSAAVLAVLLALVSAACTDDNSGSRLRGSVLPIPESKELTVDGQPTDVTAPPTTRAVDASRSVHKSSSQGELCSGDAHSFLPSSDHGWEIVSIDASKQIPTDSLKGSGVESFAAAFMTKSSGSGGSVLALVYDAGMAGLMSASADVMMRSFTGADAAERDSVGGHLVYRDAKGSAYLFWLCKNVSIIVQSEDPGTARAATELILA